MNGSFLPTSPEPATNANLECQRALAALAVMACHTATLGGFDANTMGARLAGFGAVGVDLFFVISGWVITASAIRTRHQTSAAGRFWWRRAARLLPLYLVTSIVFLLLVDASALTSGEASFQISTHLLMIHNWFPNTASAINPVTWTLGIEVQLYMMSFLAVRWGLLSRQSTASRLTAIVAVGLPVALAWRIAVWFATDVATRAFWMNQPFGMLDGYLLGAVLACVGHRVVLAPKQASLLGAFGLLWIALVFAAMPANPAQFWQSPGLALLLRLLLAIGFFAMVVAAALGTNESPSGLFKRGLVALGKYSYGIYLWHLIVILLATRAGWLGWPLAMLTLVLTVALAALSFHLIERPVQQWARQ
jgi:peptidoglycan/LPS O-acetylase OafA/YrhL